MWQIIIVAGLVWNLMRSVAGDLAAWSLLAVLIFCVYGWSRGTN
jgi:chromate transport protein ChrA